jgi:hypothetical protein
MSNYANLLGALDRSIDSLIAIRRRVRDEKASAGEIAELLEMTERIEAKIVAMVVDAEPAEATGSRCPHCRKSIKVTLS